MQNRNKTIEEIEQEIHKVKEETRSFEEHMQNQIDYYVKAKIILYKELYQLKSNTLSQAK